MGKFLLLLLILCLLGEVGCFQVNNTEKCLVRSGENAYINWNYHLAPGERMIGIKLGYFSKTGEKKYLASKVAKKPVRYGSRTGRYRQEETTIIVDDFSKVELTLKHVQLRYDEMVEYFVSFMYNTGTADYRTQVIVLELPVFRGITKSPFYVKEDDDATLPCQADGKPPPDIRWYKRGSTDILVEGKNRKYLSLSKLKRLKGDNYTCVASNRAGSINYTVALIVQYKPVVDLKKSPKRVGTFLNNPDPVYLVCVAHGEPPPTYKWSNPLMEEVSTASKLVIQQPRLDQMGKYICEATNIIDFARHPVQVYEIKKPKMLNITVTMVERRTAVVSLDAPTNPGGGSIHELQLSYNAKGKTPKKKVLRNRPKKVTLNKLTPHTKYTLNVTVRNKYFTSDGQKYTFETKEAPPGPPSYVILEDLSPYSMKLSWKVPVEKNGFITEYTVYFYDVNNQTRMNVTRKLQPQTTFKVFKGLQPYTVYNASVKASTVAGEGDWSRPLVRRSEPMAPGPPQNISWKAGKDTESISISWLPPYLDGPAPLTMYAINATCISKEDQSKLTKLRTSNLNKTVMKQRWRELILNLMPFSNCSVVVREGAGALPKWGEYSSPVYIAMPETVPDQPQNLKLDYSSHDHLVLTWQRPKRINGLLDRYEIRYTNSSGTLYSAILDKQLSNTTFYYKLKYLKEMTIYTISIVAHTKDYDAKSIEVKMETIKMPTTATAMRVVEGNAGPIIGGVLTVIFILVLAGGILLYVIRKKKEFNRASSASSHAGFFQKGDNGLVHLVDGPINAKSSYMMSDYVKNAQCTFSPKNPIPITSLKDFVQKYHASKAQGFIDEFRSVKSERVGSLDISSRAENKCKNRYANILAYDHSRVVLNTVEDLEGSDYVNANYIDGYNKKAKFIATQGPVVAAFNDFWRMIWEQDASKIIMVTNLVEKSRIKCQKYWPCENEKGVPYGNIKVQMIDELPLAEYVVRRFSITQMKDDVEVSSRTVTQYQFLSWPDHGVPQYPTSLLQFVKRVRALDQGSSGPIVCHCSAGVGRTGTYITLDAMLDQIENEKTVDVLGYVTHIRGQRQLMVQTEAQYIFIYDTLLEAVSCGNTEVTTVDLFARIKHLDSINPGTTRTYMQEEFERVSLNIDDSNQYEAALLAVNIPKNRYPEVLPYELTRVKLWPYANLEGSDYINASFIDGYQQREAYILTQSPLENTVEEFWRMLWEYEIFTIVMISSTTERSKHHCYPYWPLNSEPTLFGILAVQLAAEEEKGGFIRRVFRVTNSKKGDSRTISHFMYFDWPTEESPDTASAIEMIGQVQKTQQQTGNSAIVIHCSDGSGRSGSLAALMYCLERLKLEGLLDVFQTVRSMRTQRTALVQSLEQYHFIYMAVSNFLDCFSNYANFK